MDRDTLIAALVGALIATIPILISNIVQIIIHISENRQKEREAKIQDKKKCIERDILEIMDSIDVVLNQMAVNIGIYKKSTWINPRKTRGYISDEDVSDESNLYFEELGKSLDEFRSASAKLSKLIPCFCANTTRFYSLRQGEAISNR